MLLAYIDETYTDDDFWIICLVIPEAVAKPLEAAMNDVVARANKSFPEIAISAELHGYALDAGSDDWKPLKGKAQARVDIYTDAIKAICQFQGIYLIRTAVHLSQLSWGENHDAHEWALKFLFEKIDKEFLNKELVLAICDDVGQREKYRTAFAKFKVEGTGGSQPRKLEAFVDALHFVPSHHSRLVQATDLIAYVFRRTFVCPPANEKSREFYKGLWYKHIDNSSFTHRIRTWPNPYS